MSTAPGIGGATRRELQLAGADNVRDLGDLPTVDGRRTVRGRLFRGELLPSLVEEDVKLLVERVGLHGVVDLRSRGEVRHHPGRWLEHGIAWVHCPFRVAGLGVVPGRDTDYVGAYLGYLEADPRPVALAARTLMNPDFHPALFHCAAGKDRTGTLSALLLELLGVTREAIGEDYASTNRGLPAVLERLAGMDPYRGLTGADPADHEARAETIVAFLARLDAAHGGAEGWLLRQGVTPGEVQAFRASMLL